MPSAQNHIPRKLAVLPLAAVIFMTVSGGPYGLEPLMAYAGAHGALIFLLLTPLVWDLPTILTVLELNSMMPVNGGYYQWVKGALGLRWAFYEGWWTWLYTFADLAIYPVLFVQYGSFFFPQLEAWKIPVCLLIIWGSALLNILGIVPVGRTSLVLGTAVLLPFFLMFALIWHHHAGSIHIPYPSLKGISGPSAGLALFTVMWNYIGWDNATTYCGEVQRPVKAYLKSILMAFGAIFIIYFLAVFTAQQAGPSFGTLQQQGFPALGRWVGGEWLGMVLAVGGMASTLGIFSAVLLSVSRVPEVMAEDRLMPAILGQKHPVSEAPWVSIIACAGVVSLMVFWSFSSLIIIDVSLYGAGLFLEFISLIVLRFRSPGIARPFRIPLGKTGLMALVGLPVLVFGFALVSILGESGHALLPVSFTFCALISAEPIWQLIRLARKRPA